jgi:quaternary ammonium compound-resistance protein SugE
MAWVYLVIAAMFEVGWAVGLKSTQGFTKFWPTVATLTAMLISVGLLAMAVRTIPIGTGYAAWTGLGTVGAVLLGMLWFDEPATAGRLFFLLLIIAGVIGLKFTAT